MGESWLTLLLIINVTDRQLNLIGMMHVKKTILNRLFLFSLLFISANSIQAQMFENFYLEGIAVNKFSIGKETIEQDNNQETPKIKRFDSPVFGLNFSLNYKFTENFLSGIGSGINVVHKDKHPILENEYYDKIMLPVFAKFRYRSEFSENWLFLTDLNAGYQFSQFLYGYNNNAYDFEEKGGLLANLDIGFGRNFGKYTPIFKVGYEINQFKRIDALSWNEENLLNDPIKYKINYHLIKLSFSIRI